MTSTRYKRRVKLVRPGLQQRLILRFIGIAALAMVLQFLMLGYRLADLTPELPYGGTDVAARIPGLLMEVFLTSLLVFLPIMFWVGVTTTFRIAGPVARFESYLRGVIEGKETGHCRLREGDELQDLCTLINEALDAARAEGAQEDRAVEDEPARRAG